MIRFNADELEEQIDDINEAIELALEEGNLEEYAELESELFEAREALAEADRSVWGG